MAGRGRDRCKGEEILLFKRDKEKSSYLRGVRKRKVKGDAGDGRSSGRGSDRCRDEKR